MKKILFILLAAASVLFMACNELETVKDKNHIPTKSRTVSFSSVNGYDSCILYAREAMRSALHSVFDRGRFRIQSNDSMQAPPEDAFTFGTMLGGMTSAELDSFLSMLETRDLGISINQNDSIDTFEILAQMSSTEDALQFYNFCDSYPLSEDKPAYLQHAISNLPQDLQNLYVMAAAFIDEIGTPLADGIEIGARVHFVGEFSALSYCKRQLVLELAKMCLQDVLITFAGGGPEDPVALIGCVEDDIITAAMAALQYRFCVHENGE